MTNNAEARAREVLGQCCPGMGWSEGEKQTIATAMLAYGDERAAQEREANAAIAEQWRDENKASAAKARKRASFRGEDGLADMLDGAAIECNAIAREIRARGVA